MRARGDGYMFICTSHYMSSIPLHNMCAVQYASLCVVYANMDMCLFVRIKYVYILCAFVSVCVCVSWVAFWSLVGHLLLNEPLVAGLFIAGHT